MTAALPVTTIMNWRPHRYVRNLHGIRANHNEPVPRWIPEEIRLKNTTTRMHAESWFTNSTMWDCG